MDFHKIERLYRSILFLHVYKKWAQLVQGLVRYMGSKFQYLTAYISAPICPRKMFFIYSESLECPLSNEL